MSWCAVRCYASRCGAVVEVKRPPPPPSVTILPATSHSPPSYHEQPWLWTRSLILASRKSSQTVESSHSTLLRHANLHPAPSNRKLDHHIAIALTPQRSHQPGRTLPGTRAARNRDTSAASILSSSSLPQSDTVEVSKVICLSPPLNHQLPGSSRPPPHRESALSFAFNGTSLPSTILESSSYQFSIAPVFCFFEQCWAP